MLSFQGVIGCSYPICFYRFLLSLPGSALLADCSGEAKNHSGPKDTWMETWRQTVGNCWCFPMGKSPVFTICFNILTFFLSVFSEEKEISKVVLIFCFMGWEAREAQVLSFLLPKCKLGSTARLNFQLFQDANRLTTKITCRLLPEKVAKLNLLRTPIRFLSTLPLKNVATWDHRNRCWSLILKGSCLLLHFKVKVSHFPRNEVLLVSLHGTPHPFKGTRKGLHSTPLYSLPSWSRGLS